jgi:dTMP kinase
MTKSSGNNSQTAWRGRLIAIEGINGIGKSTQCELLRRFVEDAGLNALTIKGRHSDVVAEAIVTAREVRANASVQGLLFAAGLYDQFARQAEPVLAGGGFVIADRWVYSARVREELRGAPTKWLAALYERLPMPDLTVFLIGPVELARGRLFCGRGIGYWECGQDLNAGLSTGEAFILFQEECQKRLLAMLQSELPAERLLMLDASPSIADIHRGITTRVKQWLRRKMEG